MNGTNELRGQNCNGNDQRAQTSLSTFSSELKSFGKKSKKKKKETRKIVQRHKKFWKKNYRTETGETVGNITHTDRHTDTTRLQEGITWIKLYGILPFDLRIIKA